MLVTVCMLCLCIAKSSQSVVGRAMGRIDDHMVSLISVNEYKKYTIFCIAELVFVWFSRIGGSSDSQN